MDEEHHLAGEVNDFNAVYSDVITFVAALFILLFSLSYSEDSGKSIFDSVELQMQQKKNEEQLLQTQAEVDDLLDQRMSQFVTREFQQQQIKVSLNDPLLFEARSSVLKEKHKAVIDHFMSLVSEMSNTIIIQGEASKNEMDIAEEIAFKRAKAVYDYLINELKFPKDRLVLQTSGLSKQINKPDMLQQNVSFFVIKASKK